jgi:hypothetical protein
MSVDNLMETVFDRKFNEIKGTLDGISNRIQNNEKSTLKQSEDIGNLRDMVNESTGNRQSITRLSTNFDLHKSALAGLQDTVADNNIKMRDLQSSDYAPASSISDLDNEVNSLRHYMLKARLSDLKKEKVKLSEEKDVFYGQMKEKNNQIGKKETFLKERQKQIEGIIDRTNGQLKQKNVELEGHKNAVLYYKSRRDNNAKFHEMKINDINTDIKRLKNDIDTLKTVLDNEKNNLNNLIKEKDILNEKYKSFLVKINIVEKQMKIEEEKLKKKPPRAIPPAPGPTNNMLLTPNDMEAINDEMVGVTENDMLPGQEEEVPLAVPDAMGVPAPGATTTDPLPGQEEEVPLAAPDSIGVPAVVSTSDREKEIELEKMRREKDIDFDSKMRREKEEKALAVTPETTATAPDAIGVPAPGATATVPEPTATAPGATATADTATVPEPTVTASKETFSNYANVYNNKKQGSNHFQGINVNKLSQLSGSEFQSDKKELVLDLEKDETGNIMSFLLQQNNMNKQVGKKELKKALEKDTEKVVETEEESFSNYKSVELDPVSTFYVSSLSVIMLYYIYRSLRK